MSLKKVSKTSDDNKFQTPKNELDYFVGTLNDDCIFHIFDYLSVYDLCAVSQTCVRLKQLSTKQFQRKFKTDALRMPETVSIAIENTGEIFLEAFEDHTRDFIKCFTGCIRIVHIKQFSQKHSSKISHFLRSNWNGNIQKLSFEQMNQTKSFVNDIKGILNGVETLEFHDIPTNGEVVREMLNCCGQLKNLKIRNNLLRTFDVRCPTLELFQCRIDSKYNAIKLEKFLRKNPNVTTLVCSFQNKDNGTKNFIDVIQVVLNVSTVTELYLKISTRMNKHNDWNSICNELNKLNERTDFKRLEIFVDNDVCKFSSIKSLNGVHVDNLEFVEIATINRFAQLKTLYVNNNPPKPNLYFEAFSQNLPAVETLFLDINELHTDTERDSIYSSVSVFVANSPTLKKLILNIRSHQNYYTYYINCLYTKIQKDLNHLNDIRNGLHNAYRLEVCVCEQSRCYKFREFIKEYVECNDMVSLKPIQISYAIPNSNNPLLPTILNEN